MSYSRVSVTEDTPAVDADFQAELEKVAAQVRGEANPQPQPAATAPASATPPPSEDDGSDMLAELEKWKRQAEESDRRHKGLQPVVQREVEQRKALEQRLAQMEQDLFQARLAMVPEEQRDTYQQQYQTWQQAQTAQQQLDQQNALLNQMGKFLAAQQFAAQAGEPVEVLMQFDSPEAMQAYATRMLAVKQQYTAAQTRQTKTQAKQEAAASGQHRFEGGGSPSAPVKTPTTFDEARAAVEAEMVRYMQRGR